MVRSELNSWMHFIEDDTESSHSVPMERMVLSTPITDIEKGQIQLAFEINKANGVAHVVSGRGCPKFLQHQIFINKHPKSTSLQRTVR
ncbi:hypothetical protein CEXT_204311 [Caerostris extrusa]|uniref:Uncharacterized protein n=1 Tax=Caerostris extrusa TaxID=172846 RepID=A0AAV4QTQ1_CAEEX|nr:hypothetical protein CEXT_204311 [Caerostris extrusa]